MDILIMNPVPALLQGRNVARVNQTQIHDIDRNLRIVRGLQLIPYHLIAERPFPDCRFLCHRRVGEPEGIDTVHVAAISRHRVAAGKAA
jgi:hypothetical protein